VVECLKCGQGINIDTFEKRVNRGSPDPQICRDCTATPRRIFGDCVAWMGDVDLDTLAPLKRGKLWLPGVRVCGKRDCVNRRHILGINFGGKMKEATELSL